jgi:hypothetical protein
MDYGLPTCLIRIDLFAAIAASHLSRKKMSIVTGLAFTTGLQLISAMSEDAVDLTRDSRGKTIMRLIFAVFIKSLLRTQIKSKDKLLTSFRRWT